MSTSEVLGSTVFLDNCMERKVFRFTKRFLDLPDNLRIAILTHGEIKRG